MRITNGPFTTVLVARVGDRVELAPHLDRWMMGDRMGTVVRYVTLAYRYDPRTGTEKPYWRKSEPEYSGAIRVKLDVSGKTVTLRADGIGRVIRDWQ